MKIYVTKEDIRKGDCFHLSCPIALSLKRRTGIAYRVGAKKIYLDKLSVIPIAVLPKIAQRFINDFDHGQKSVKPFSFNLDLPKINKLKNRKKSK